MDYTSALRRLGLFDARVPRFTSYPPANQFSADVSSSDVTAWLTGTPEGADLSLYVHIPFCRRLCWFCACRTQGTKTNAPLAPYVASVLAEAERVRATLPNRVVPRRLHLGGGTPTLLPPQILTQLLGGLDRIFGLGGLEEFSVEIDPVECDRERLKVLTEFGLNRASLGVQDFEPQVQSAIGRQQSPDVTRATVDELRAMGVEAINFDLLYGLPFQTAKTLDHTLAKVLDMAPTRLALYGYAHVPWMSKRQGVIPAEALPDPEARFGLFQSARKTLLGQSHLQIGIDHFARPGDALAQAFLGRRLGRSFQGYTDDRVVRLVGLGASSISRFPQGYVQNQPSTRHYQAAIRDGVSPVTRGVRLSRTDRTIATIIEHLMCYHDVQYADLNPDSPEGRRLISGLALAFPDAVQLNSDGLSIHRWARPLVRIIAARLSQPMKTDQAHSSAI